MKRVLRSRADYAMTLRRNQLTSLILFEAITTTKTKAKDLLDFANRFFTRVQPATPTAHRFANELLLDKNAVEKLFADILPRFSKATNYVRGIVVQSRRGDNAQQMIVTFLQGPMIVTAKPKDVTTKEKIPASRTTKKQVKVLSK